MTTDLQHETDLEHEDASEAPEPILPVLVTNLIEALANPAPWGRGEGAACDD